MFRSLRFLAPFLPRTRRPLELRASRYPNHFQALAISTTQPKHHSTYHGLPWLAQYPRILTRLNILGRGEPPRCGECCKEEHPSIMQDTKSWQEDWLEKTRLELEYLKDQNKIFFEEINKVENQMVQLKQNFNPCTALARIVAQGRVEKKIKPQGTIQSGLDNLAKRKDFEDLLKDEVEKRQLVHSKVMECVHNLYDIARTHELVSGTTVIVRSSKFAVNERAALVVFLKLHNQWGYTLDWREEKLPNEDR